MFTTLAQTGRKLAKQLLVIQCLVVVFLSLILLVLIGVSWGWSALLGGCVFIFAQSVFAWFAFRYSGARAARNVTNAFYAGESLKIVTTIVLFSIIYLYTQAELIPLLLTYFMVLTVNACAPILLTDHKIIG